MIDAACLVYLNNRYYDPTIGAFVSVDPLVSKTGQPYLYGNGNPSTLSDPNGLSPADACRDFGGGGACARATYNDLKGRPRPKAPPGQYDPDESSIGPTFDQQLATYLNQSAVSFFGKLGQWGASRMSDAQRLAYLHVGTLWMAGVLKSNGSGGLVPAGSLGYVYFDAKTYAGASDQARHTEIGTLFTAEKYDQVGDFVDFASSMSGLAILGGAGFCVFGVAAGCVVAANAAAVSLAADAYSAADTCLGDGSTQACNGALFAAGLDIVPFNRAGQGFREAEAILSTITQVVGTGAALASADPTKSGADVLLLVSIPA